MPISETCVDIEMVNSECPPLRDFIISDSELRHQILYHSCGDSSSASASNDAVRTASRVPSETMTRLRISVGLIQSCGTDIRRQMVSKQIYIYSL